MKTAHDLVTAAKALVQEVPLDQADEAIRAADVLIDVREADEYQAGHIPGAIHASRGVLEFRLSSTPELSARDLKVVLYCKTSGRAALAATGTVGWWGWLGVVPLATGLFSFCPAYTLLGINTCPMKK